MNFNLIVSPLNEEPVQYELNAKRIGIGRESDNQIVLDYDTVSSSHCEIRLDDDRGWVVEDIGSKNGTRVNGRAVLEPRKLEDGDRLLIGETVPCHFIALADGEEYSEAVTEGGDQESVSKYVQLNDKLQELEQDIISKTLEAETLEGHLARLRDEFESKKSEYETLFDSIQKLQKEIETADPEEIDELQSDLMEKTQRITLLKSDIKGTEAQIDDLENTKKTALKAPVPPTPAPAAPKVAPPVAPAAPKVAAPTPAAPKVAAPAPKPAAPAATVPIARPKPPASVPAAAGPAKPGEIPLVTPTPKVVPTKPEDL